MTTSKHPAQVLIEKKEAWALQYMKDLEEAEKNDLKATEQLFGDMLSKFRDKQYHSNEIVLNKHIFKRNINISITIKDKHDEV